MWCASCLCSGSGELGHEKARGLPAQSGAPVTCALAEKNWVVVTQRGAPVACALAVVSWVVRRQEVFWPKVVRQSPVLWQRRIGWL